MKSKLVLLLLLSAALVSLALAYPEPQLPEDNPNMRDLIECWQYPGEKKEWRSLTDGLVIVTDEGVIRFSNNGNERALVNMECRVTYDVAWIK